MESRIRIGITQCRKVAIREGIRVFVLFLLFALLPGVRVFAQDNVFPEKPVPPRMVNDFAGMMSPSEQNALEAKLHGFENTTSNEITIVTIKSLGDYDVSDYAIQLGKKWGVGKSGKNNGVLVLASLQEHKINISTGKGLEGALTDMTCGEIIRNEMVPLFKNQNYYQGFDKAADAIIAATKGEYKADKRPQTKHVPLTAVIIIVIFIIFILRIFGRGGGGGNYMSGRGFGGFATGWFLGNMLGGGWGGGRGGDWGGGGNDSGGGWGGFGGGDFGGGGASGSW